MKEMLFCFNPIEALPILIPFKVAMRPSPISPGSLKTVIRALAHSSYKIHVNQLPCFQTPTRPFTILHHVINVVVLAAGLILTRVGMGGTTINVTNPIGQLIIVAEEVEFPSHTPC